MGRTSVPRRRVAVLSTSTRRWSRRGREVLLGKQDLPKSATAPMTNDVSRSWVLFRGFSRAGRLSLLTECVAGTGLDDGQLIDSGQETFQRRQQFADACGLPLNEQTSRP